MKSTVQKNIRFTKSVVDIIEPKAKILGYSFSDYVKFLVAKDIEDDMHGASLVHDKELIKDILTARNDSKAGKLSTARNAKEVNDFLDSL